MDVVFVVVVTLFGLSIGGLLVSVTVDELVGFEQVMALM
jgi:hypothetical protein